MTTKKPTLEHIMTVKAQIAPVIEMGSTPRGRRRLVPIIGGTFEAKNFKGTLMPGGEDWQLIRDDGTTHLDARYALRAEDGSIIRVHNKVLIDMASASGKSLSDAYARSVVTFEAPNGNHDWLNKAIFIGTIDVDFNQKPAVVTLNFYKVA
jgi:hypothetical protein